MCVILCVLVQLPSFQQLISILPWAPDMLKPSPKPLNLNPLNPDRSHLKSQAVGVVGLRFYSRLHHCEHTVISIHACPRILNP